MTDPTIQTVDLPNGLTLKLTDSSRKIAGDRWLVAMTAQVAVPVDGAYLPEGVDVGDAKKTLGYSVVFEKKMERNFIADNEKEPVLLSMTASFLKTNLAYLSHENFPSRFIMKSYREGKSQKGWYS